MNKIYNDIDGFIALQPRYYYALKSIHFSRNITSDQGSKYSIEIILSKLRRGEHDLKLRFENAVDIKVGCIEGILGLLVEIENIKDRQIEGGVYKVVEQEENSFSFLCEEFSAELI